RKPCASSTTCTSCRKAWWSHRGPRMKSAIPKRRSFISSSGVRWTALCLSTIPANRTTAISSSSRCMLERLVKGLRLIGHRVVNGVWRLGYASRFFALTLLRSGISFRRFGLTIKEIYFAGVLSLIIVIVSGLFVGMVLGLQGYETLQKYGSAGGGRARLV